MSIPSVVEDLFQSITDTIFKLIPRPLPDKKKIAKCRIVSHRGVHDNRTVFENTIPAFERAFQNHVWGIELDVRWTKDHVPVVYHDPDLIRLNNRNIIIKNQSYAKLRKDFPIIPTLSDIIERYGSKMHLMVEIKKEEGADVKRQNQILSKVFDSLIPVQNFHILSLSPDIFEHFDFVPNQAFIPVADININRLSVLAHNRTYAGFAGHYAFITDKVIKKHHQSGQFVGTGYICSKNSLFREINRNVTWIFSNHALYLQKIIDDNQ